MNSLKKLQANQFFNDDLASIDPDINDMIRKELKRQQTQIELIASENITSQAVLEAQGSIFTNKYAEGYPAKRYYGGCEFADQVENLAIERVKKLFDCQYANVQPNSGSQANQAVFMALLNPGDTILGLSLAAGGHLTHGAGPNQSGKWFNAITYGVKQDDHLIDYDEVENLAKQHQPKLIIAGCSAYARFIDFARFRQIADSVNAYLLVDMAHFAGLVASGVYPSPLPHAHIVTSTTHKTLRGPRGGIILSNFPELVIRKTKSGKEIKLGQAINSGIFPGIQGGPLMHVIAAKAVAFGEALQPSFNEYGNNIVENAKILAKSLTDRNIKIVSGGTDSHVVLVDLTELNITGKDAEESLERAALTCNKNAIPYDTRSPFITSGIRLGTPAGTTRGFGTAEFNIIGNLIADILESLANNSHSKVEQEVYNKVQNLCSQFPIYPGM